MPELELAVMLPLSLMPFFFAYVSFNLSERQTSLKAFFMLLSLVFVIPIFGVASILSYLAYPQLDIIFKGLTFVSVLVAGIATISLSFSLTLSMINHIRGAGR
jgi:hypothetical protein